NWNLFDVPGRNFDEVHKHDPLVVTATTLYGRPQLPADDRIKVLEAMYDSRHHAQERLWSGENLETNHVVSNIRIYPNLRLAYTEKTLTIRNNHDKSWNSSEEAIYTFHLPEGAVVTSLSLWINGKEENAILTSKNKADSAYRTVVGYEMRDPSLVRWQEGNTVSVRVFPCTPDEDRKFKIGITSPLSKTNNKLIYHNIWFDGPLSSQADESIKLLFMDNIAQPNLPSGFEKLKSNTCYYEGSYNPDWQFSFDCPTLKENNFSFDGKSYTISDYQKIYGALDATDIYLDINNSWTKDEFSQIVEMCQSKKVFVYADKLIKVNGKNREELFDELHNLNFSVFPFYTIAKPGQSLVITKGTTASPNLSDLKGSEFSGLLYNYLKGGTSIKLFNLGGELSPYIKTLKELRAFKFDSGNTEYLSKLIKENKFIQSQETKGSIVIDEAAIQISENEGEAPSNAPDHLMRLFAYNHVMYSTGIQYLNSDFYDKTIVDEAYKAYVVSPSTSLVVLETKKDYERFGIQDQGSSLKNASMKSSGAVPEPHEWVLILLLAGFIVFLYVRNKC
ncbi:MAG TPA: XrtN system VIT domain-containing protein, partial [Bacteroidales bacterium]|nr:XrtN system VIT domain-containing protein [Bacteroidales bacterium]